jgi:SHS family lactate transporter-like MFS transporter
MLYTFEHVSHQQEEVQPMALISDPTFDPKMLGQVSTRDRVSAFLAGMAGWTLDAFDFFLVVFSLTAIGATFHQTDAAVALSLTATLLLRPVGAFLFGAMADRFGRKPPLILNLVLFAVVELATAFAPGFKSFLLIRAIFGIVMGGQWGIGASLAMEKVPIRLRGVLSGLLQQGYSIGYLLAAIASFYLVDFGAAFFSLQTHLGLSLVATSESWRILFMLGSIPALLAAVLCYANVKESEIWRRTRHSSFKDLGKAFYSYKWLFLYMTIFMMSMNMSSHGTQDLYPTFLQRQWHLLPKSRSFLTGITAIGGVLGGVSIGFWSDRIGRKRAMIIAIAGAMLTIPLWAFAPSLPLLVLGGFLMQFMVQGAWGVVPAHLAEMAPDSLRGSLPGLGYQFGVLIASVIPKVELSMAAHYGYPRVMAGTMVVVLCIAATMTMIGRESHSTEFGKV